MLALLLVGVGATIYWIFKYDDWNPNPINNEHIPESDDSGHERLAIGAESYSH